MRSNSIPLTLASLASALALSACASTGEAVANPEVPSMPSEADIASGKTCGADQLAAYVGQPATDDTIAALRTWRGDKPVRVIHPNSPITMDFRPERLNIHVDKDGRIESFRCV